MVRSPASCLSISTCCLFCACRPRTRVEVREHLGLMRPRDGQPRWRSPDTSTLPWLRIDRWARRQDRPARRVAWPGRPTAVRLISAACWTACWPSDRAASCTTWCSWWRVDRSEPTGACWPSPAIISGNSVVALLSLSVWQGSSWPWFHRYKTLFSLDSFVTFAVKP